ncbi:MAG: TraR/DksA C4-type zinc finger protein [Mariniphaga sp.]|nr:TraR/DksA C4-type zinc finger protein [Mariniphaga sp.]
MEDTKRDELKDKIKSEIVKTEKHILEYRELSKPIAPENSIGRISRMDAINNRSISEAALKKAEKKLSDLKYMFSQIEESDFGTCIRCKKPIPMGRLLLMPQSNLCVNCSV